MSEDVNGTPSVAYSYSAAGSMTSEITNPDVSGNATSNSQVINYSYDPLQELTGVSSAAVGSVSDADYIAPIDEQYTYDSDGDQVEDQSTTAGVTTTTQSIFDGGQDLRDTTNPGTTGTSGETHTDYLWDPTSDSALLASYGTGRDNTGVELPESPTCYHTDQLGSVIATTSDQGLTTATYRYDAFGNVIEQTGAVTSKFQYLSNATDTSTKTDNFHARSYSASDGRFDSTDPITAGVGETGRANQYAYGLDNPLSYTDADGQWSVGSNGGGYGENNGDLGRDIAVGAAQGCAAGSDVGPEGCVVGGLGGGIAAAGTDTVERGIELVHDIHHFIDPSSADPSSSYLNQPCPAEGTVVGTIDGSNAPPPYNNWDNGRNAETKVVSLINQGDSLPGMDGETGEVIGTHVTAHTDEGIRYIDILVAMPNGQLIAYEVKSGDASRDPDQIAKDDSMEENGAVLGGPRYNPPEEEQEGYQESIPTVVVRVKINGGTAGG